jgi:hypothetical protein
VGIANSQKKSPRSSAKSEKSTADFGEMPTQTRPSSADDDGEFMDRSLDLVARVRAAREAAQREMESFGDASEYDVTIIFGRKDDQTWATSQTSLSFETIDGREKD